MATSTTKNKLSDDIQTTRRSTELSATNVSVRYGDQPILSDISLRFRTGDVTALIGPSGSGKSIFLRCLNRMNDQKVDGYIDGLITLDGQDIYADTVDATEIRARIGMVFQTPCPFPTSIYDNVAYGPRIHGLALDRADLDEIVASALEDAALWDDVKDDLDAPGTALSLGQQQRLCLARALALDPDILLMDEPCSSLDPIATAKIEALIDSIRDDFAIVIVTHSMQQAARISNKTAFFDQGRLIEYGDTTEIFTNPTHPRTSDYLTGRLG